MSASEVKYIAAGGVTAFLALIPIIPGIGLSVSAVAGIILASGAFAYAVSTNKGVTIYIGLNGGISVSPN
ncbi:hypothetical protein COE50_27505 [Bacillus anthracis]|nr:hypothetical protein COE50_27505 [Bacillus anthracis]